MNYDFIENLSQEDIVKSYDEIVQNESVNYISEAYITHSVNCETSGKRSLFYEHWTGNDASYGYCESRPTVWCVGCSGTDCSTLRWNVCGSYCGRYVIVNCTSIYH